jgi:hypothetical protein
MEERARRDEIGEDGRRNEETDRIGGSGGGGDVLRWKTGRERKPSPSPSSHSVAFSTAYRGGVVNSLKGGLEGPTREAAGRSVPTT